MILLLRRKIQIIFKLTIMSIKNRKMNQLTIPNLQVKIHISFNTTMKNLVTPAAIIKTIQTDLAIPTINQALSNQITNQPMAMISNPWTKVFNHSMSNLKVKRLKLKISKSKLWQKIRVPLTNQANQKSSVTRRFVKEASIA